MTSAEDRPRLNLLECGRGLAAFAVVLFHANVSARIEGWAYFDWFGIFEYGVDFFFVLSGFIIYFAHSRDFGHRGRLVTYLQKRSIRLLPTLWLVTTASFAVQTMLSMPVDLPQYVRSALPYPSLLPTDPPVVWTLRHEFLFYAAIGVAILSRRLGIVLFSVWLAATVGQLAALTAGRGAQGIASFFVATYSLDFFFGMALAAIHARWKFRPSMLPLIAGLVLLALALFWDATQGTSRFGPSDYTSVDAAWFTLVVGLIFALVVHGLVLVEQRVAAPYPLVVLGGATYSLYLVHAPINGFVLLFLRPHPELFSNGLGMLLLICTGTLGGIALHRIFEGPANIVLKRHILHRADRKMASGRSSSWRSAAAPTQGKDF